MPRNAILGSITLAASVVYFWLASSVPVSRLADAIGPQGLPKAYALALVGLSLALIISSARSPAKSQIPNPKSQSLEPRAQSPLPRVAGTLLIGVVYILVLPWVGYLLSIAALILVTTYYQGGSLTRSSGVVAIAGGIFFWLLFVALMGISMPGPACC